MVMFESLISLFFFFFNDTATTEIYTLSLHDALPISLHKATELLDLGDLHWPSVEGDRKSTRLNSSHVEISYAVFCLKNKKKVRKFDDINNEHNLITGVCSVRACP